MITGFHGDLIWEKDHYDISEFLIRHDPSSAGLAEFTLHKGIIQCPIAFWGIQHGQQIQALWRRSEMKPWTLGTEYDRPIPRRIVEEAGVPRKIYARRKTVSGEYTWSPHPLPLSQKLRKEYVAFLEMEGIKPPHVLSEFFWRTANAVDWYLLRWIREVAKNPSKFRLPFKARFQGWRLFIWSNEKVREKYAPVVTRINARE